MFLFKSGHSDGRMDEKRGGMVDRRKGKRMNKYMRCVVGSWVNLGFRVDG